MQSDLASIQSTSKSNGFGRNTENNAKIITIWELIGYLIEIGYIDKEVIIKKY